jgi:uncharacterized protein with ParB-like and HNH nuclease domain
LGNSQFKDKEDQMIQSVNNYPVSSLFDTENKITYFIPLYQREYSWGKSQWETLFDDIIENESGYFLGSIICINNSNDAIDLQKLEVVDGQQRLTTLSILFIALFNILKENEALLTRDQYADSINLNRRLIIKQNGHQRLTPQLQNNNADDYRSLLIEFGVIEQSGRRPSNAGNRRIYKAFNYFKFRISEFISEEDININKLFQFLDKLNQASIVKIEVSSHTDAYILFESLNNRGMPLTSVDLIKNKLLAKLSERNSENINNYFERWSDVLKNLGDDFSIQERFFRQLYNALKSDFNLPFAAENKTEPLGPLATKSNLIGIYEKIIDLDAKAFLDKLVETSNLYSQITVSNTEDLSDFRKKEFQNLDRIQAAPSYIILLHLMVHQLKYDLNDGQIDELIKFLVIYSVRRNLTDFPPTRDLSRNFMSLISNFENRTSSDLVHFIKENLVKNSASDEMFKKKLEGPIYEENYGVTRFLLCSLAEDGMNREFSTNLWIKKDKIFVFTVEHIFPQGERIPQDWVDMIADGDLDRAKQIQSEHVHTLGNLTISAFNSALSNFAFIKKRDRQYEGNYVGYKNKLNINEEIAHKESWTLDDIFERKTSLVQKILAKYSF